MYVGSQSQLKVFLFARTPDDLVYSSYLENSDAQPLRGPDFMRRSPEDAQLYIPAEFSRTLDVFGIGAGSGLTNLGFVADGVGGPSMRGVQGFVFNSDGTRLYGTTLDPGGVVDFARDPQSGELSFIEAHTDIVAPGVTLSEGGEPSLSPDDRHLYVPDSSGQLLIFGATPEPDTTALAALSCVALFVLRRVRAVTARPVHAGDAERTRSTTASES